MAKELNIDGKVGGFPLFVEDFRFLQEATNEQHAFLAEAFGGDTVVLFGLEVFDITKISKSAILFEGELFEIDETTVAASGPGNTLHQVTSFDPLDPTTYKDLSAKNVHEIRKMEFQTASASPEDTGLELTDLELLRVSSLLLDKLYDIRRWASLTIETGWIEQEIVQLIKEGNTIRMRGRVQITNESPDTLITGIPTIFRPVANRLVGIDFFDTNTSSVRLRAHVTVTTTGSVIFDQVLYNSIFPITSLDALWFDGSFYTR